MRILFGFTLIFFNALICHANNSEILHEFKELNKHYNSLTSFSIDISLKYFDTNGALILNNSGTVLHSEKVHYMEMGNDITLIRDDYYLALNKAAGFIVFNETDKKKSPKRVEENLDISNVLDSLWENQKDIHYELIHSKKGTMRVLITHAINVDIDAMEIMIDTKTNQLKEFTYYFKSTDVNQNVSKVIISYSDESNQPKLNQPKLKLNFYLAKKEQNYYVTERFKNFKLINHTPTAQDYE